MGSRDDLEPNNDACCSAGIATGPAALLDACEMRNSYTVTPDKKCWLSHDAVNPEDDSNYNIFESEVPIQTCCSHGVEQQSEELITGACEMQTEITFADGNCTETDNFVDESGAVVLFNMREEGNDYCCAAFTETGDEDLLDACEMTETFNYPQADACTSVMKFITSDGTVIDQSTESHANDVCCQEWAETAANADALLNACEVSEDYEFAEGTCTSTADYTTAAGEVMFTSFAEHEAAECCYWGQDQGLPVYLDEEGDDTEPLYTQCEWQEATFTNGQCFKRMVRDAEGELYEDLVEETEDVDRCCALAIVAEDDAMWTVCDAVDFSIKETVEFTTFTECSVTKKIINAEDEVLAQKTESADCPCQDEIPMDYSET